MPDNRQSPMITSVEELIELLAAGENQHDEPHSAGHEAVDLLSHGLQCAERLRRWHPDDLELQVAGLVHDIGHQLCPGEDALHGEIAAEAIRDLLGERVARLVVHHVPAKRYLVSTDPGYLARLSPVSLETLGNQGGPMSAEEITQSEGLEDWAFGLVLRRADEAAKSPGREVPDLKTWIPVLHTVAADAL